MFETCVFTLIYILLIAVATCYAYIDPGTGSYVIQVIIALLAGFLFSIKLFWKKIFNFFKKIFKRPDTY